MESNRRLRLPGRRAYGSSATPRRPPADGSTGLFAELRRRKVFKVGAAYLVFAWVAVQVMSIALPAFDAPPWALRVCILVALLGFPITLVLAWMLDATPGGLRLDPALSGNKRVFAGAGVLVLLALAWFFLGQASLRKGDVARPTAAAAARPVPVAPRKSIAVLSFENLSGDADNAYFVSGMQDLILTNLAKIRDLKVISRTSTDKYASHPENLRTVGAELGVATLLEGSVQRAGSRVLINLQLIDAHTDTHLWAETYDRSIADVFAVEQEIASTVADALHATLSQGEAAAIADRPTRNAEAYDLFLRGEYLYRRSEQLQQPELLAQASAQYRQAIARDPTFALAQANLSYALSTLYWNGGTRTLLPARLAKEARTAMEEAKRLQPDLPEAHLAEAWIQYWIDQDFPRALAAFDRVLASRPGEVRALKGKAFILRRMGRPEEAISALEAAVSLSPRDPVLLTDLGTTHWMFRRPAEAEADYRHALALDPANFTATFSLAGLRLYRAGDADGALAILRGDDPRTRFVRMAMLRFDRRFAEALAMLATIPDDVVVGMADVPKAYLTGVVLYQAGRRAEAIPQLRQARTEIEASLRTAPANYGAGQNLRLSLADIEAMLGNEAGALAHAQRALTLMPIEKDALNGVSALGQAAAVYAELGRADLAVPALARMRALPFGDSLTSASTLRRDPLWDGVRADPGFQAEVKRYAEQEKAAERN